MSLAKIFGGGKKKDAPPTTQEAIQKLRSTEELLQKKSNHLEGKISEEIAAARKAGTKNKRLALNALKRKKRLEKQLGQIDGTLSTIEFQREALENANTNTEVLKAMGYAAKAMKSAHLALNALKRKKRLEKQLGQIDGTLSTIEFQREALENANTNTEVLKAMGYAAKAMKSAHQELDVDDVHDMMDDISEQTELANEISEAISSSVGYQDVDEDDLLQELDELEQETLDEQMLNIGPTTTAELPSVPQTELPKAAKKKVEEEDDMAELAAWAN